MQVHVPQGFFVRGKTHDFFIVISVYTRYFVIFMRMARIVTEAIVTGSLSNHSSRWIPRHGDRDPRK